MNEKLTKKVLKLYPEFKNIYGPYVRKDNIKIVVLYDGIRRIGKHYATVKFEALVLRRRLTEGETVDHVDSNTLNCKLDNLRCVYVGHRKNTDILRFRSYMVNYKNEVILLTDEDYYTKPKFKRRYHYYNFCFVLPVLSRVQFYSFIHGLNNKFINTRIINRVRKKHKTPRDAIFISATYLGYMTQRRVRSL